MGYTYGSLLHLNKEKNVYNFENFTYCCSLVTRDKNNVMYVNGNVLNLLHFYAKKVKN